MKRIVIIIAILLLVGCSTNNEEKIEISKTNEDIKEKIVEEEQPVIEEAKVDIAMYSNEDTNNRKKISNYDTNYELNVDMIVAEVYFTNDEILESLSQKELWHKYYDTYTEDYKIGYNVKFSTIDGENIDHTFYRPSETSDIYGYMQIYLYDDINQEDNKFYTHMSDEEMNDNTILTSIKLTGSTYSYKINSDIELTAFVYKDKNTNIKNTNNKYTIKIKRK